MFSLPMKKRMSPLGLALLSVVAILCVRPTNAREDSAVRSTLPETSRPRLDRTSVKGQPGKVRLREGTIVSDQSGYFHEDGDGATFVADSGMEFGALPNLNLERVVRLLKNAEEPSSIRWSVTGEVTEFAGRNFLLISRAVYKAATPPPVPDRIEQ